MFALACAVLACPLLAARTTIDVTNAMNKAVTEVRKHNASDKVASFPTSLTVYLQPFSANKALLKRISDSINTPQFKAQKPSFGGLDVVSVQIPGTSCNADRFAYTTIDGQNYFIYVRSGAETENLAGKLWAIKFVMKVVPTAGDKTLELNFPSRTDVECPHPNEMYPTSFPNIKTVADLYAWRHRGVTGAGEHGAFVYRGKNKKCFRLDLDGSGTMPCAVLPAAGLTGVDGYNGPMLYKKKVLVVIDVQDGYNAAAIAATPGKGGIGYLDMMHDVEASYELGPWNADHTMKVVRKFSPGKKQISYNKGWNTGLPESVSTPVVNGVNALVERGDWDLIVYTHDYLDPTAKGVFPLDDKAWSDPKKEVALVDYSEFLTIAAQGAGIDTDQRLSHNPHCATRGPGIFKLNGQNVMCFRKQVDDAFNDQIADSGGPRVVDPKDDGKQNPHGQLLIAQLAGVGYGPDRAILSFTGVVTSRCVQSSLVHACNSGYETELIKGACADVSVADHEKGIQQVRTMCPTARIEE